MHVYIYSVHCDIILELLDTPGRVHEYNYAHYTRSFYSFLSSILFECLIN